MKYFIDTKFYENQNTIDLISIGIVSEDIANSRRYNGSNFQLGYFCGLLFAWIILLLIK